MVNINDCTIRYYLGLVKLIPHERLYELKSFVYSDYNKGWIPEMIIYNDDKYVWAYFTVPLRDSDKRLIQTFTGFDLTIEERLC